MELKLTEYQQKLYDENVNHKWSLKVGHKTTVVVIRLHNGFEITGTSACLNPRDFVFEIGEHYALVDALSRLDEFVNFSKQEQILIEVPKPKKVISSNSVTINLNNVEPSKQQVEDFAQIILKQIRGE